MKAVVEPFEGNEVKLSVEVDGEEFEEAVDAAYPKMAREVRVPEFRQGKGPRSLLDAVSGPPWPARRRCGNPCPSSTPGH